MFERAGGQTQTPSIPNEEHPLNKRLLREKYKGANLKDGMSIIRLGGPDNQPIEVNGAACEQTDEVHAGAGDVDQPPEVRLEAT